MSPILFRDEIASRKIVLRVIHFSETSSVGLKVLGPGHCFKRAWLLSSPLKRFLRNVLLSKQDIVMGRCKVLAHSPADRNFQRRANEERH